MAVESTALVALAVRLEKIVSELLRHGYYRHGGMEENNKRDETDFLLSASSRFFTTRRLHANADNRIAEPAPTGSHQHGRTCLE
ncbi:hypothetical protein [Vreelandella aquamarina]|uniref:hypothetical protein n=1 Tax=Vreelandella aquamarina TaxID=77097 RepID=UPI00384A9CCC